MIGRLSVSAMKCVFRKLQTVRLCIYAKYSAKSNSLHRNDSVITGKQTGLMNQRRIVKYWISSMSSVFISCVWFRNSWQYSFSYCCFLSFRQSKFITFSSYLRHRAIVQAALEICEYPQKIWQPTTRIQQSVAISICYLSVMMFSLFREKTTANENAIMSIVWTRSSLTLFLKAYSRTKSPAISNPLVLQIAAKVKMITIAATFENSLSFSEILKCEFSERPGLI